MLSVIDFFCGCGGTSAGLRAAGMRILAGIDNDKQALATYQYNFPNARAINADITALTPEELCASIDIPDGPLLISACAPCQPFSSQNKNASEKDSRRDLLHEMHKFILFFKPEYIVLENVPGIQRIAEGPLTAFTEFLTQQGYFFDVDVKSAHDYGVPQQRKRLVLVASLTSEIVLPDPTHGPSDELIDYVTVWDAIKKYPPIPHNHKDDLIANHDTAMISPKNLERLKNTPEGGDWRNWPDKLLLDCHIKMRKNGRFGGYTDTYGRLQKDAPSITLTTKCISISNGRFGHPQQDRALSVREAAALQTFDDEFLFIGTVGQTAKQVGNAVPVQFAKALGLQIVRHFEAS